MKPIGRGGSRRGRGPRDSDSGSRGAGAGRGSGRRRRRESDEDGDEDDDDRGRAPPKDDTQKIIMIAVPIGAILLLLLIVMASGGSSDTGHHAEEATQAPKKWVYNEAAVANARRMHEEARQLLQQAQQASGSGKRGYLRDAQSKLNDAADVLERVRAEAGEPPEGVHVPFDGDWQRINEAKKVVRTELQLAGD